MDGNKRHFNNPYTGHEVTFLQTADETDGELLQLEYVVTRPEQPGYAYLRNDL